MQKLKLNYTHNNSVAQIILDDDKGNVLDSIMMEELQMLLDEFKTKNDLKLIIIEGAGKHFSFGASVAEHQKEFAQAMLHAFHKLFYAINDLAIPTLAKVTGQCLGGGMELALACNVIFADKTAKFGQPEIVLGVIAPAASVLLPEKIGYQKAEELLITGRTVSAEEAKQTGLVNELFEDKNALETGTEAWIQNHILPKSASSLRFATKAARVKFSHIIMNFLPQLENFYVKNLMNTYDANEGINAFLDKRKPEWRNE